MKSEEVKRNVRGVITLRRDVAARHGMDAAWMLAEIMVAWGECDLVGELFEGGVFLPLDVVERCAGMSEYRQARAVRNLAAEGLIRTKRRTHPTLGVPARWFGLSVELHEAARMLVGHRTSSWLTDHGYDVRVNFDDTSRGVVNESPQVVENPAIGKNLETTLNESPQVVENPAIGKNLETRVSSYSNTTLFGIDTGLDSGGKGGECERGAKKKLCGGDENFDSWWKAYGKPRDKAKTRAVWDRLTDDERAKVVGHTALYVNANPNAKYRRDPIRYLRSDLWHGHDTAMDALDSYFRLQVETGSMTYDEALEMQKRLDDPNREGRI